MGKDVNIKAAANRADFLKSHDDSKIASMYLDGIDTMLSDYRLISLLTYLVCVNYHPSRAIYLQFPWKKFINKHREAHRQQFVCSLFICRFCSSLSDTFPMLPDAKARRKSTSTLKGLLTHPITLLLLLPRRKQFSIERSQ